MEFFIPILPKSFLMILHKLLLFLIILSRPVQSISINGHRTALTATFSKFDLDIIPNPTVRFQISNNPKSNSSSFRRIRWSDLPQYPFEVNGRNSRTTAARRVLFRPLYYIYNIYNIYFVDFYLKRIL